MAYELPQEVIDNLVLDADAFAKFILGLPTDQVVTRTGAIYRTLQKIINDLTKSGGFPSFLTQAELLASVPETVPVAAKALDTKKVWYYGRSSGETVDSWHDTGLSELDQAKDYFNSFFSTGVNIYDKSAVLNDKYYLYSTGEIGDSVGFTAGLFSILPNTEYKVPNNYTQQMAFFTRDMQYIRGIPDTGSEHKFTTPENTAFVGITVEKNLVDTMMICKTAEYPTVYVPFKLYMTKLAVHIDQIDGFQDALDSVLDDYAPYKVNVTTGVNIKRGYYINWFDGSIGPSAGYNVVGPCEIFPETEYLISKDYRQQFALFDADYNYIEGHEIPPPLNRFTTPENAKYVTFTVPDSLLNTIVVADSALFDVVSDGTAKSGFNDLIVKASQVPDLDDFVAKDLGLVTINIIDPANAVEGKYVEWNSGGLGNNPDYFAAGPYEIKAKTQYQVSDFYPQQFAFYSANMTYISGMPNPPSDHKFTTPDDAKFIAFSVHKDMLHTLVVAESSLFPAEYVPHGVSLAENLRVKSLGGDGVKTNYIWISADENETDPKVTFKGKNAWQLAINSITDATATNRYEIHDIGTTYKVDKAVDFIGYLGYPAMILTKDHVDLVGQGRGKTVIYAELPYNDDDIGPSADGKTYPRLQYQTIYSYADDSIMKDMTCIAKNLRYTIHIDNPNGANKERKFDNVDFIFKGDKGGLTAMGCGTSTGERSIIVGGQSFSDRNVPFASHNNTDFDKPSYWSFTSHSFVALANVNFAFMQNDGSLLEDQLELVGCSFGGRAYQLGYVDVWLTGNTAANKDSFNHAEWHITGYGNDPFLFKNDAAGKSLRFTTTAKGASASIRFDKNSSAYGIIIKNNQNKTSGSVLHNGREYMDGYIVQDGSVDLPARAWACRDIYEGVYLYDNNVNYTRLGVRLGDCTSNNKTLGVIINGTLNNIVFNKNYTSMQNSQIIAEMNAQLSGAVIDSISYGRDYYPTITDVCEPAFNITATYIPKGSLVAKSGGYVRLAGANDKIYGVALDDIPVMITTSEGVCKGEGRVLKRGYISASQSEAFYVLADNQNPTVGTKFSVNNGQLVTDANGKISVDIDAGVVSINC